MTTANRQPVIFSDILRRYFRGILGTAARFLLRLGLTPNLVTLTGLGGHVAAAVLIAAGYIPFGGLLLVLFAPLDALDGAMARELGQPTRFGSFLDSITDRYAEFLLWAGLLFCYLQAQDNLTCLAIFGAAAGSALVPYMRAKAEALGFSARVGILSRVERYLILVPLLVFNQASLAIWIIAILSNVTALQRILFVRKESQCKPLS